MPTLAQAIKQQIAINLQALQTAGVINSFVYLDQNPNVLNDTAPNGYPFAIVGMPRIASDYEDQANNIRTYKWDILVVFGQNGLADPTISVEGVMDKLANQFDTNFTLAGTAAAAQVPPVQVEPLPLSTPDLTYVCFVATITARTLYQIGS